jgi:hypothetical protein
MISQQSLIYPHRIYFIEKENNCDFCEEKGKRILNVDFNPFLGLWSCNNDKCIKLAKDSLFKTTVKYERLVKLYGDDIKIIRSNGNIENGWSIYGAAVKQEENEHYWVNVKKKGLTKSVRVSDIELWNNSN